MADGRPPGPPPSGPPPGGPTPTGAPAGGGPVEAESRNRKPALLIGIAVAVIVGLVIALVVTNRGGDGKKAAGKGEIFLESASSTGPNPFTRSVATGSPVAVTTTTRPPASTSTVPSRATVQGVQGSQPGLYGGTRNNSTCDPEQLISFLQANPGKAGAWSRALGIPRDSIATYVRRLTPVILTGDTRVTNYGYRDGRPTPRQAVLQAGTAVLVDEYGIPRVKCGCGNPLTPPVPTPVTPTYTGTQWPGWSPTTVTVVVVNVKVNTFVLVDPTNGVKFDRPPGTTGAQDGNVQIDELCALFPDDPACAAAHPGQPSLGRGDVQVTLRWSSTADLDLSVTDPTGATVSFQNKTSPSGGQLDVDANTACNNQTTSPVENVFWRSGTAPDGVYTVSVNYFRECAGGAGPQPYTLAVLLDGALVNVAATTQPVAFELDTRAHTVRLAAAQPGRVITGTLQQVDAKQTYTFTKGGGATPSPGGSTPAAGPCDQYEPGTPRRTLCEAQ